MHFFTSKNYNPEGKWRNEPATEFQFRKLDELKARYHKPMTKGDASDLISQHLPAESGEVKFVKFFGVELPENATSQDAREAIYKIRATKGARKHYGTRPADKEQRAIVKFVDGKIPRKLEFDQAKALIKAYEKDPKKDANLQEYWDIEEAKAEEIAKKEETQEAFEENVEEVRDLIKDYGLADYGLKSINLKLIKEAAEQLKESGRADLYDPSRSFDSEDLAAKIAYQIMNNHPDRIKLLGYTPYAFQDYTDHKLVNDPVKSSVCEWYERMNAEEDEQKEDLSVTPKPEIVKTGEVSGKPTIISKDREVQQSYFSSTEPQNAFGLRISPPDKWAAEKAEQKARTNKQKHVPLVDSFTDWLLIFIGFLVLGLLGKIIEYFQ